VEQGPRLAIRPEGRIDEGIEIEQERLVEDLDRRDLVGELVEAGNAKLHGSGSDRTHDLIVVVRLAVVEDLDRDRLAGSLLDLLLELSKVLTKEQLGHRDLQRRLQLHLLGAGNSGQRQDTYNHQSQH